MTKTNEILEIVADVIDEIGPVKALKKIWDKVVSEKIQNVFKNCANQLNLTGNIEEEFREKLDNYAESEFGQETVYSLVQKSINSESKDCCKIIGVILGHAMLQNRPLSQEERVLSEALTHMTDYDLELLINIHLHINVLPIHPALIKHADGDQQKLHEQVNINSVSISDFFKHNLISGNANEAYYSVERMKSLHILKSTALYAGTARAGTAGLFKLTNLSVKLVELHKQLI